MLSFIPSLGTGEVFAFGSGVPLPTRMKFREVPEAQRPASEAASSAIMAIDSSPDRNMIISTINRWRSSTMSNKGQFDEEFAEASMTPLAPTMPEPPFQPQRPSILRRPLSPDVLGPNTSPLPPNRFR